MPIDERLKDMLIEHEGLRFKPYHCPAGKLTIGVGRNLEDNGISRDEALMMLENDVLQAFGELAANIDMFTRLSYVRQSVLIDMCFNLGLTKFLRFKKMIAAVEKFDFETAAREMLNSKWAKQVGNRAYKLSEMMKTGEWYYANTPT